MKPTFHKILVPVDFSLCSIAAFRAAAILGEQFGAELWVLHVIDSRIVESLSEIGAEKTDVLTKRFRDRARSCFRSFLSETPAGLKIHRVVVLGAPFQEIVKMARVEQMDLIVMGRYGGAGEMEKIFFGSTAEKVVRIAPCAVLSIPLTGKPT